MSKPIKVDYERLERREFDIYKESILQRLDIYVHKRMPDYSRTLVQKLIKDGLVTVNGKPSKPSYEINMGDKIVCDLPKLIPPHVVAVDIPLEIVYEDDRIILRPQVHVPRDQAYFWTRDWQAAEQEAEEDVRKGRTRGPFPSVAEMAKSLKRP